jgi:hypothetical protein
MNYRMFLNPKIVSFLFSCITIFDCEAQSPQKIDFEDLKKANYSLDKTPFENDSAYWRRLIPTDELRALEGKYVSIEGYVVAFDPDSNFFVLSSFPAADNWSTFFLDGRVAEEILDLRSSQDLSEYDPLTKYEFKGVLRLNTTDPYQMSLILEEAEPISKPAVLKALHIEFKDLSQVKFSIKTDPISGMEYEVAEFPESIKKLNGKTISIEGYFQTIIDDETFILTDTIYNTLVNCGHLIVGKEKIIALESKTDLSSYEENSKQTFIGWLELNESDPYEFTYILHIKK